MLKKMFKGIVKGYLGVVMMVFLSLFWVVGNAQAGYLFDDASCFSISNVTTNKGTVGSCLDNPSSISAEQNDIIEWYLYLFNGLFTGIADECVSPKVRLLIGGTDVSYYNTSYAVSESADGVSYTPLTDDDFTTTGVSLSSSILNEEDVYLKFQLQLDVTTNSNSLVTVILQCWGVDIYTKNATIKYQMAQITSATDDNQQVTIDFPVNMTNDDNYKNKANYTIWEAGASSITVKSDKQVVLTYSGWTITGGNSIQVKINGVTTANGVDLENTGNDKEYLTASFTVVDTIAPQLVSAVYDPEGGDNGQLRIIFDEGMDTSSIASNYADIITKLSLSGSHILGTAPTRTWTNTGEWTPTTILTINLDVDQTVTVGDILVLGDITDDAGNSARGQSIVITQTPMIVNVSATNDDKGYKLGDKITVQLEYNIPVIVEGTPTLTLETGSTNRTVDFVENISSGTGSLLSFDYVIQVGDENAELEYFDINSLNLDIIDDSIKDQYGSNADLTLPTIGGGNSLTDNKSIKIDGILPTFTAQRTGENTITITFSELVEADNANELTAWTVAGGEVEEVTDPAGTNSLTITTSGLVGTEATPTVNYVASNGTIADLVGNKLADASRTATDLVAPNLVSAKFTANNQITVVFSEAILASSSNFINLETISGADDLSVDNISGSSSDTIIITLNGNLNDTTLNDGQLDIVSNVQDEAGNNFIWVANQAITDGQAPNLTFSDNVNSGADTSDTIIVDWGDASITKWDYSDNINCSLEIENYSFTGTTITTQTTEVNNNKYICLYAEDTNNNKSVLASDYVINIDTTAPVISNISPTGIETATGTVILGVTTDENADCKYDLIDRDYDLMAKSFGSTGEITHSDNYTADSEGEYTLYVRCKDWLENKNSTGAIINFTVDASGPSFSIQYYETYSEGTKIFTDSLGDNPKLKTGTYYLEITSSEPLQFSPTIDIEASGMANDVSGGESEFVAFGTSGTGSTVIYKYERIITADDFAVWVLLENINITGTDTSGHTSTTVNPTNEFYKVAYIDTKAPVAVTLVWPENNYFTNNTKPTFRWEDLNYDETNYEIQIATDNNFSNIIDSDNSLGENATSFTPFADLVEGEHYRRVRAIDQTGNQGAWSVTRSFTLDTTNPIVNNIKLFLGFTEAQIRFEATDINGVDFEAMTVKYDTSISGSFTGSFLVEEDEGDNVYLASIDNLLEGETYYYQINVFDYAGNNFLVSGDDYEFTTLENSGDNILTLNNDFTPPASKSGGDIPTTLQVIKASDINNSGEISFDLEAGLKASDSEQVTVGSETVTLTQAVQLTSSGTIALETGDYKAILPANLLIKGEDTWNGKLMLPKVLTGGEDEITGATVTIEVGDQNSTLIFDKAVKLEIPITGGYLNTYNYTAQFKKGNNTYTIQACPTTAQLSEPKTLKNGGSCYYLDIANDQIIIWTKHFTKFAYLVASNQTTTTTSKGGGGWGRGFTSTPTTPTPTPTTPTPTTPTVTEEDTAFELQSDTVAVSLFTDIVHHWAEQFITNLVADGIVSGINGGDQFRPDLNMNRVELIKVALLGAGFDVPELTAEQKTELLSFFVDINEVWMTEQWWSKFVYFAYQEGFIKGYKEGYFFPEKKSTRAEALKVILNIFGFKIVDSDNETTEGLDFADIYDNQWYLPYLRKGLEQEVISGYEEAGQKLFKPGQTITRAEVVKIIYGLRQ